MCSSKTSRILAGLTRTPCRAEVSAAPGSELSGDGASPGRGEAASPSVSTQRTRTTTRSSTSPILSICWITSSSAVRSSRPSSSGHSILTATSASSTSPPGGCGSMETAVLPARKRATSPRSETPSAVSRPTNTTARVHGQFPKAQKEIERSIHQLLDAAQAKDLPRLEDIHLYGRSSRAGIPGAPRMQRPRCSPWIPPCRPKTRRSRSSARSPWPRSSCPTRPRAEDRRRAPR